MEKHIHELEFQIGTKDIICMGGGCDYRIDRDEIIDVMTLLFNFYDNTYTLDQLEKGSLLAYNVLVTRIWHIIKENYEDYSEYDMEE